MVSTFVAPAHHDARPFEVTTRDNRRLFVALDNTHSEVAWFLLAFFAVFSPGPSWASDTADELIREQVQRLGSDSFTTRQRASESLILMGDAAIDQLVVGLTDDSLEVRIQSRTCLRKTYDAKLDQGRERLLTIENADTEVELPLWRSYSTSVGNDEASRGLYCDLLDRYREVIVALSGDTLCGYQCPAPSQLNPLRVPRNDTAQWTMMLLVDQAIYSASLSTRLSSAMTRLTAGPNLACLPGSQRSSHDEALRRLVGVWIASPRATISDRDRLLIAMRYACRDQAIDICTRLLNQPHNDPRAIELALLAAAAMEHPSLANYLISYEVDRRTIHHCPSPRVPGTAFRTQIADVVLALRLYGRGLDPRSFGFANLQADPIFVFCPESLGFANSQDRHYAYDAAQHAIVVASQ